MAIRGRRPHPLREPATGQDFDERARARLDAAALGMLVEDGALFGVGETLADRALHRDGQREPLDQVRVMTSCR